MKHYLQALALAASLLASTNVPAQEHLAPGPATPVASVELAQFQHYGHWDVYYLWYGQPILYGSFTSHEVADHYVLHLAQHYHVQAWHVYHY